MKAHEYYKHARNLGPFRAEDALSLAREAAELDRLAAKKNVRGPVAVSYEVMPDGEGYIRASNSITVY